MKKIILALILALILANTQGVYAANQSQIDVLEDQIKDKNKQVKGIQKEISQYQKDLAAIGKEKNSLKQAINGLDVSRRKLTADINLTEQQVDALGFSIEKLNLEIRLKENNINLNQDAIGESIRQINEVETQSFVETLLSRDTISAFWNEVDNLGQFQAVMQHDLQELNEFKIELEGR